MYNQEQYEKLRKHVEKMEIGFYKDVYRSFEHVKSESGMSLKEIEELQHKADLNDTEIYAYENLLMIQEVIYKHRQDVLDRKTANAFNIRSDFFIYAVQFCFVYKKITKTMLKQKLSMGFPRAKRLWDRLEKKGFIDSKGYSRYFSKENRKYMAYLIYGEDNFIEREVEKSKVKNVYPKVKEYIKGRKRVSTQLIKIEFELNYAQASVIVEMLEEEGFLSKRYDAGARRVLIS